MGADETNGRGHDGSASDPCWSRRVFAAVPFPSQVDFQQAVESLPYIAWLSAPDGSTEYFNRLGTRYTGLPPETNYEWGWVSLVHPDDTGRAREAWEHATRTESLYELEYRIRRADGCFRWHGFRAAPVRTQIGQIVKWIGIAVDIHDARQPDPPSRPTAQSLASPSSNGSAGLYPGVLGEQRPAGDLLQAAMVLGNLVAALSGSGAKGHVPTQ